MSADAARVLVVEDNGDLAFGLRNNLEIEGYEVDVAEDGKQGLERVRETAPDLVILDLMLPELDGFRVLLFQSGQEQRSETLPGVLDLVVGSWSALSLGNGDLAASVLEGGTVVVTTADLDFVDPDDGPGDVTFTVSNQVNGTVLVNGLAATTFSGLDEPPMSRKLAGSPP